MLSFLISSGQVVYFQTVSSHSQRFFKIRVLKNFVKLTGKYLCRSLQLITLRRAAFFKTRLRHNCFIANFVNFLKTTFLQNNFGRMLLSSGNVFAISRNLILFSQRGFPEIKDQKSVLWLFLIFRNQNAHKDVSCSEGAVVVSKRHQLVNQWRQSHMSLQIFHCSRKEHSK